MANKYVLHSKYVKIAETKGIFFNAGIVPIQISESTEKGAPYIMLAPGKMKNMEGIAVYAKSTGGETIAGFLNVLDLESNGGGGGGNVDNTNAIVDIANDDTGNIVVYYKNGGTKIVALPSAAFKIDSEGYITANTTIDEKQED